MRSIIALLLVFFVVSPIFPVTSLAVASPSSSRNFHLKSVFAAGNIPPSDSSNSTLSASRRGKFLKRYDVTEGDGLHTFSSLGRLQWREGEIKSWSRLSRKAREDRVGVKGIVVQDGRILPFLGKGKGRSRRPHQMQSPLKKQARVPDHTDPETVLTLGRMTYNSYIDPEDKTWIDIPGWDTTDRFGWVGKGIRGYVFTDDEAEQMIIVLKGTTLATPVGGGPTAPEDKFNVS